VTVTIDFLTYTRCDKCECELPESVRAFLPPLCEGCEANEVGFFEEREAIRARYLRDGAENPYTIDDDDSDDFGVGPDELPSLDDEFDDDDDESDTDATELPDGFFGDSDSEDAEFEG
jgi:hypothetical protein